MTSLCNCSCNDPLNITSQAHQEIRVRPKEIFILVLFFVLLLYSVISFLTQWNKNYREINHLPYYEIYIEENPPLTGMWEERGSLARTDSRISRIVYNHQNFVSKARRAQSCRVQNSRRSRVSRRRSLGANDEPRLEEIVSVESEEKPSRSKRGNFTKSHTVVY